jgi:transcriptional regulator with XRE-family HTH domain
LIEPIASDSNARGNAPDQTGVSDEPVGGQTTPRPRVGIGPRIRHLRRERGLIQRELAEAAELSLNAVSLIERGQTSPTVATLERIARALDVPLVSIFQVQEPRFSVIRTSPDDRDRVAVRLGRLERLGRGLEGQKMEAVEINLQPGYSGGPRPQIHAGHELVYVVAGTLSCRVGDQDHHLQARQSLLFEARIPHRYGNPGTEPARAVVVSWEPDGPGGSLQTHFS